MREAISGDEWQQEAKERRLGRGGEGGLAEGVAIIKWQSSGNPAAIQWQSSGNPVAIEWQSSGNQEDLPRASRSSFSPKEAVGSRLCRSEPEKRLGSW